MHYNQITLIVDYVLVVIVYVQAGLAINDNYSMWLSHHQKLSSDGQKSSQHIRLDMLTGILLVGPWKKQKRVKKGCKNYLGITDFNK